MQLNEEQAQAVSHYEGTCIVTAVPGSGKTHVLTSRVIELITNRGVDPRSILCLTFTNKAANEMKERVTVALEKKPDVNSSLVWISTFHRLCLAILRKHGHLIGLPPHFTIYPSKDQADLITKIARMNGYEDISKITVKVLAKAVNDFREDMLDLDKACQELDALESTIVKEYLKELDKSHLVDFSGMLYKAWLLLSQHPNVAASLSNRFQYVLVDEMQDTNRIQYDIIKRIASHQNLFVVGDVQQSIYGFRGAKPENLNKIRTDFSDVSEVVLPRNYRSTSQILALAEALIHNNHDAHSVKLISNKGDGSDPHIISCSNPEEEASRVAHKIIQMKKQLGYQWHDFAVLYRLNSMSRSLEMVFRANDIPYRIVGGFSFFDRTEVKTTLSYLSLLTNSSDTVAFARAVKTPRRGIGDVMIGKLERIVQESGTPILDICTEEHLSEFHAKPKANLLKFARTVQKYKDQLKAGKSLSEVADGLIRDSGYYDMLKKSAISDHKENQPRLENVQEFVVGIEEFEAANPQSRMEDYLQSVQLLSDLREKEKDADAVVLLTMHSSKGLEWPCVFVIGVEQGTIPHYLSIKEGNLEEERRLLFVSMTRAMSHLQMSHCFVRRNNHVNRSSFLDEIC